MTIEAQRRGARIREVDVPDGPPAHRAERGRLPAPCRSGHRHPAGPVAAGHLGPAAPVAASCSRCSWPSWRRRSSPWTRGPRSDHESGRADRVVLFGLPRIGLEDLRSGDAPNLTQLAGERRRRGHERADAARHPGERGRLRHHLRRHPRGGVAGDLARRSTATSRSRGPWPVRSRSGARAVPAEGEVVVIGAAATIRGAGDGVSSEPGALGDALHGRGARHRGRGQRRHGDARGPAGAPAAGRRRRDDQRRVGGPRVGRRHGAAVRPHRALRRPRRRGRVPRPGSAGHPGRRLHDPGPRASSTGPTRTARPAARSSTTPCAGPPCGAPTRCSAPWSMTLPEGTMLLVVAVTPPSSTWELTPLVAYGAGVHPGRLVSPSTQRIDLVDPHRRLRDGARRARRRPARRHDRPALRVPRTARSTSGASSDMNEVATGRERVYFPVAITFIVLQAFVYLVAILVLSLGGQTPDPVPARAAVHRRRVRVVAAGDVPRAHRARSS